MHCADHTASQNLLLLISYMFLIYFYNYKAILMKKIGRINKYTNNG